ncbi:hypothetical protein ACFL4F_01585 [Candidatus Margulisiibacteriota bacterium]
MRNSLFKNLIIAIAAVSILALPAFAEIKSTVDITRVGKGARPIALGGAYTAIADDAFAIFTNPAGLGLQDKISLTSMNTQILGSIDYKVLGGVYPTDFGTIAVGYVNAASPAGNRTDGAGVESGAMYYSNTVALLSYGTKLSDALAVGASVKIFSQGFSGDISGSPQATGSDMDFGFIYKFSDDITIGSVFQNFIKSSDGEMSWSTGQKEEIVGTKKLGVAYQMNKDVKTTVDLEMFNGSAPLVIHGGAEWKVLDYLTVRGGIDQNFESTSENGKSVTTDLSAGLGIALSDFVFDYAYCSDHAIAENATHYFSISYYFPTPEKEEDETVADIEGAKMAAALNKELENADITEEDDTQVAEELNEELENASVIEGDDTKVAEELNNELETAKISKDIKESNVEVKTDNSYSKSINKQLEDSDISYNLSTEDDDFYSNLFNE